MFDFLDPSFLLELFMRYDPILVLVIVVTLFIIYILSRDLQSFWEKKKNGGLVNLHNLEAQIRNLESWQENSKWQDSSAWNELIKNVDSIVDWQKMVGTNLVTILNNLSEILKEQTRLMQAIMDMAIKIDMKIDFYTKKNSPLN